MCDSFKVAIKNFNLDTIDDFVGDYEQVADAVFDNTLEDNDYVMIDNAETDEEVFSGLIHEAPPFWSKFCI